MFWALLPMIVFAQTGFVEKVQKSSEGWGKVSINQESRLTRLLNGDTVIVQEKKVEEKNVNSEKHKIDAKKDE